MLPHGFSFIYLSLSFRSLLLRGASCGPSTYENCFHLPCHQVTSWHAILTSLPSYKPSSFPGLSCWYTSIQPPTSFHQSISLLRTGESCLRLILPKSRDVSGLPLATFWHAKNYKVWFPALHVFKTKTHWRYDWPLSAVQPEIRKQHHSSHSNLHSTFNRNPWVASSAPRQNFPSVFVIAHNSLWFLNVISVPMPTVTAAERKNSMATSDTGTSWGSA